jgi:hypothetical protein
MKKVTLLATVILALVMSASAQKMIDFTNLPDNATPAAIPSGYAHLNWSGLDYVDALTYGDANGNPNNGAGFYTGPEVMVAFGGGPLCFTNYGAKKADGVPSKNICESTISSGLGPTALNQFQVDYAVVSSGWVSNSIVVQAYLNGVQVGSDQRYNLTTQAQKLVFPNWGPITELVIHPSPGGSFVMYVLELK